jgi:hypothetical protein
MHNLRGAWLTWGKMAVTRFAFNWLAIGKKVASSYLPRRKTHVQIQQIRVDSWIGGRYGVAAIPIGATEGPG